MSRCARRLIQSALCLVIVTVLWSCTVSPTSAFRVGSGLDKAVAEAPLRGAPLSIDDARSIRRVLSIAADPTGELLAVQIGSTIEIVDTETSALVAKFAGTTPSWSPDGMELAYYDVDISGAAQIFIRDRSLLSVARQLTEFDEGISPNPFVNFFNGLDLAWSPESTKIAFTTRVWPATETDDHVNQKPRIRVLSPGATHREVFEGIYADSFWKGYQTGNSLFELKRMQSILRSPEVGLSRIFIVNVSSGAVHRVTVDGQEFAPSWSPDGTKLVVVADRTRNMLKHTHLPMLRGGGEITIINLATGIRTVLSSEFDFVGRPKWSIDGTVVSALVKDTYLGFTRVEQHNLHNRDIKTLSSPSGRAVVDYEYSPTGEFLMLVSDRFRNSLWAYGSRGGDAREVSAKALSIGHFSVSKDGRLFVDADTSSRNGQVYELTRRIEPRLILDANPQLADLSFGVQKRVVWQNQLGEEIDGILIFPPKYDSNIRYPVIVDVYPRPARDVLHFSSHGQSMGQLQASWGFVVFRLPPRTPFNMQPQTQDESYIERARGVAGLSVMLEDVRTGLQHLVDANIADPKRIIVFGHSNGGWVANYLMTTESAFPACYIVSSGTSNITFWPTGALGGKNHITGTTFEEDPDSFFAFSPFYELENVRTPVLLVVGDRDHGWIWQMATQFEALSMLGKAVTLVRYANEGHVILEPSNLDDLLARIRDFATNCRGKK